MNFHLPDLALTGGAIILAYYAGLAAKRIRLPSLVGYMIVGVIIGPSLLNFMAVDFLEHTSFITHIALGFVAFSIGSELNMASLRRMGYGIISIIFAESFAAFFVVMAAIYLLTRNLPMALIFGALAPASAPAGTVAVIQEYRAQGSLTKALYAVVGFDDGLAIIIFGFAAAVAKNLILSKATGVTTNILAAMGKPCIEIIASIIVGAVIGVLFCLLVRRLKTSAELLILVTGTILLTAGLSLQFHLSLIMTNMVVGFVLANFKRESLVHRVTAPLKEIMPLLFVLFFCLAGAHLNVETLPQLGLLGLVYILARSAGLMGGARLGAIFGHVEEKIKKYIGMGILSQAGVAIGLSLIIYDELSQMAAKYPEAFARLALENPLYDPTKLGATVITTITATCIVFEIVGPIMTKIGLQKAGEIPSPGK